MNPPRAAKRGRGRPEKPIEPDFGPIQGLLAGRVLLGYRTDPEAPSAPAIRAASRKVIYYQLWMIGFLSDEHHEAADRYLMRLEQASGARVAGGHSAGEVGPTEAQVMALADLRLADDAIGPALVHDVRQVIGWNLWPERLKPEAFRDALGRMADAWGM
ncbi:MAG: hypothetical protein LW837_20285 [Roseomonas sp.]|jgi:hypothetical protein|nr:hypothetical protein [Roseomonas sp.]